MQYATIILCERHRIIKSANIRSQIYIPSSNNNNNKPNNMS